MQEIEIQLFLRPDWAEKCSQMFVDIIQQCFAFTPQANLGKFEFSGEGDRIESR